ncbi:MAG: hypothetical protein ACI4V7_06635 [Succinivibrionaceae bacterium]
MKISLLFVLSFVLCICLSSCAKTKRYESHETVVVDSSIRKKVTDDLSTIDFDNVILTIFHDSDESYIDQSVNVKTEIIIDNKDKYIINLNEYINITIPPGEHAFVINYLGSSDELLSSVKNLVLFRKNRHYYFQTKRSEKNRALSWYVPYIFTGVSKNEAIYRVLSFKKK